MTLVWGYSNRRDVALFADTWISDPHPQSPPTYASGSLKLRRITPSIAVAHAGDPVEFQKAYEAARAQPPVTVQEAAAHFQLYTEGSEYLVACAQPMMLMKVTDEGARPERSPFGGSAIAYKNLHDRMSGKLRGDPNVWRMHTWWPNPNDAQSFGDSLGRFIDTIESRPAPDVGGFWGALLAHEGAFEFVQYSGLFFNEPLAPRLTRTELRADTPEFREYRISLLTPERHADNALGYYFPHGRQCFLFLDDRVQGADVFAAPTCEDAMKEAEARCGFPFSAMQTSHA